jgi:primosomal protein N' (replication factor Y)
LLNDSRNKQRKHFWFSNQLITALQNRLGKKEQSIIFINRRGFCFFVQCKACSFIVTCNSCSVSLTLHETGLLQCHYCGFSCPQPVHCSTCKKSDFLKKGIGTQQIVSMLEKIFPTARIGRADMDMTSKKNLWQKTLSDFESGELDMLVGTQVITKGFHFPRVTFVGIIWADLNLHFPVYNASEMALQQLIQVAGRAGRASADSLVIVQTMSDHPIFTYVNELDYITYFTNEIAMRKEVGYPPCMRLAEIELRFTDEAVVEAESQAIAQLLATYIVKQKIEVILLGPAKPLVHKIKNICARKLYLKSTDMRSIHAVYQEIKQNLYKSRIFFTPNPVS